MFYELKQSIALLSCTNDCVTFKRDLLALNRAKKYRCMSSNRILCFHLLILIDYCGTTFPQWFGIHSGFGDCHSDVTAGKRKT